MPFQRESDMYPPVCRWLEHYLRSRNPTANIRVFDTSRFSLARVIQDNNLMANLPSEWPSWAIFIDVVGFVQTEQTNFMTFVECKNVPITLEHVSQILGYSRVARPQFSFIVAPQGVSSTLRSLLVTYDRIDVLEYHTQRGHFARSIVVAKWDESANQIDNGSLITGDRNYLKLP